MRSPTAKVKGPTKLSGEGGGNVTIAPQKREVPTRSKPGANPGSNQPPNRRSPSTGVPGRLPGQPESPSNGSKVSKAEVVSPSASPKVPKITGELKGLREKKLQGQNQMAQQDRLSQSQVDPPETGRSIGIASIASESTSIHSLRPRGGRATSEPPLPRSLGHLGIPSKNPRSSPMPQGREAANSTVFEWEQAQSRRAALYSEIPDQGRSHQDSSAVNALVFGQRRTRPGSVDPGLSEDRIRPGSLMEQPAGMPASSGSREGLRRLQRSATPQRSNGVLMGDSMGRSCSEKPAKHRRRSVPRISPGDAGTLREVVFGSSTMKVPPHPEVLRQVWGGCAGQPSTRADGGRKAPQFSTLADLEGYAGLVSSTCTLTSSLPGSPLSDTSSVVEPTRRSGIRLIHDAPGASDNYQIQEASPHWPVEQKPKGDAGDDRSNTYRSLYAGAAGRSSWMGSVSRRHHCPETSSRGNASDQSNDVQGSGPLLQESAHGSSLGSGSNRCRMRRQFPSKPTTQASLISLSHDPETGRKIREDAEAWNKIFEQSAGRLTHREERRGVKSVPSSVASTKDILTPSAEPLPSPRPRPTPEEGGGAPWDRRDSAMLNARGSRVKDLSSA